ncbi:hypothetical protein AAVH_40842, partial [Aphelenchoides avenae]
MTRRLVVPLLLWAALIVAVAPFSLRGAYDSLFGGFLGQTEPGEPPSSAAVVNPDLEAHRRFKRCSTTCDQSAVVQGLPRSLGMVQGASSVDSSTTDGCTKLTITCTGLGANGYTQLSVAVPDGVEQVNVQSGAGPLVMSYECGDDGQWTRQERPVAGQYYCESRLNGRCATTCDLSKAVQGPPQTEGMVDANGTVDSNTSDGCKTATITCTGLYPDGYTHLAVALQDGMGEIDFQPGAGPLVMSYECGDDGHWTLRDYPIAGEYYCECKVTRGKAVAGGDDHCHYDDDFRCGGKYAIRCDGKHHHRRNGDHGKTGDGDHGKTGDGDHGKTGDGDHGKTGDGDHGKADDGDHGKTGDGHHGKT